MVRSVTIEQVFAAPVVDSQRSLEVAAMFGIGSPGRACAASPKRMAIPLPRGGVVLLTGPSGSGKSTLLRRIGEAASPHLRVIRLDELPPPPDRPLVDLFTRPLEATASLLALAGLGEAFVMIRRAGELSEGEKHRLAMARVVDAAELADGPTLIAADEFAAALDRATARAAARRLARWVRGSNHTLIAATSHSDLLDSLHPEVLISLQAGEPLHVRCRRRAAPARTADDNEHPPAQAELGAGAGAGADGLVIEPGTLDDLRSLAAHHYRAGHIIAATSVLRLVDRSCGRASARADTGSSPALAGVLAVVMPRLGCRARDAATGGRYARLPRGERAAAINREVRTIARVILAPAWRGRGLAVRLVRAALAARPPGVRYTEALAAMGRVNPFFERAGMERIDLPRRACDARLDAALARAALDPLAAGSIDGFRAAVEGLATHARLALERELRSWFAASGVRRRGERSSQVSIDRILEAMRSRLFSPPVYYLARHAMDGDAAAAAVEAATRSPGAGDGTHL
jgi:hypothetical protein